MKANYGKSKQPRRTKDRGRQSQAVAVVASYQAIKEAMEEGSERVEREAVQDAGAILYALVPIHIGQQYVEKWHALMDRVLKAGRKVTAAELEEWHEEEEEANVHPPENQKAGRKEDETGPAEREE